MVTLSQAEIDKLIGGYQELDPEDKALTDQYLSQHPEPKVRLKWHQEKEAQAVAGCPALTDEFWQDDFLLPTDDEAQRESLRRILALLGLGDTRSP